MRTSNRQGSLAARLLAGERLLLDGAVGTELQRRGVRTTLPLWSALGLIERPEVVRAIHLDYARAGADVLITDTFRTTRRMLTRAGRNPNELWSLNALAVQLAQEARTAAGRPGTLIAGSLAPLEDCYSPWLSPPFAVALAEHREQARHLAEAGVDFLMVETMPCVAEAVTALTAARETGLAATVGFVCGPDVRLLSGESLAEAVSAVTTAKPTAILVNCSAPPVIAAALATLRDLTSLPTGGYANLGVVDHETGWSADASVGGDAYAASAAEWLRAGAQLIGGCCGTTPEHIAALRTLLDQMPSSLTHEGHRS